MKPNIAIVRGKFLNIYEMQFYEPLTRDFRLVGFGSTTPYHETFAFPVVKLPSPMDLPDFPYKMPILNRIFTDAHYLWGLEQRLMGFDLVHTAETYFRYTQQCLDAKKKGYVRKVIATVLENIPFNNEGIRGRKEFKRRAREELDLIIALTQKTKDALIAEGADPGKITILPHFIDAMRFKPSPKTVERRSRAETTFTVLFTGRLEEYKGVFDILQAASVLKRDRDLSGITLRYLFAGDGSQMRRMDVEAGRLGLSGQVAHEHVPYTQMPGIYDRGDIFIAPSKPTPTFEEQYCTALLEAQAAGLPIVTTNTGGIPENIGNAGILVEPGDITSMARAIKSFVLQRKMRSDYAKRARKRATTVHDISIGAARLKKIYTTVLS